MVQLTHNNLTHIYIGDIMNDDEFYLITTKEVEGGEINQALWAKLMNKNKGDADKTKYDYIDEVVKRKVKDEDERLRLESEKRISELAESKRIADEKARKEEKAKADLAEKRRITANKKREAANKKQEAANNRRKIRAEAELQATVDVWIPFLLAAPIIALLLWLVFSGGWTEIWAIIGLGASVLLYAFFIDPWFRR